MRRGKGYYEVCDLCEGEGRHSHAIDGDGISTSSELWQDDDFRESYLSGAYDKTCEQCNGERVVWVTETEDENE